MAAGGCAGPRGAPWLLFSLSRVASQRASVEGTHPSSSLVLFEKGRGNTISQERVADQSWRAKGEKAGPDAAVR